MEETTKTKWKIRSFKSKSYNRCKKKKKIEYASLNLSIKPNSTTKHSENEKDHEIRWRRKNKIRINKCIKPHLKDTNFTTNAFQISELAEIIVKTKNPNRKTNQNSTILQ